MNRRQFINLTLPATGAIMLGHSCLNSRALLEINQQFSGSPSFEQYDLVINGAGLAGYFAALSAAKSGKRVLVVEKRTSPGYEISAKKKLWLGSEGLDNLPQELIQLFLPEGEVQEINNSGGSGINSSIFGDEILLFSGSIRKGMLRNLLINNVHVLLMTDICGILTDNKNVLGVLVACKHGIYVVKCKSFFDASDNLFFTRELTGNKARIKYASFVAEIRNVNGPQRKEITVPSEFGISNNEISFHPGKNSNDQLFIEFEFPVKSQRMDEIEQQARFILIQLGSRFPDIDDSLIKAKISEFALECTLTIENDKALIPPLNGYYIWSYSLNKLDCSTVLEIQNNIKSVVRKIKYSKSENNITNLIIPGASIPAIDFFLSEIDEPGFSIPMEKCNFNYEKYLNIVENCDVLVGGGGTSGAMAGIGACEKKSNTIVVDYFNDPGGTRTMGGIMGYYYGVKDQNFFKKQDKDNIRIAREYNLMRKPAQIIYNLQGVLLQGGKYVTGAIICDTLVKNDIVEGIVICNNGRLELIKSQITIDSTGDGDIAGFAGAGFSHGNLRNGKTQNYSQRDLSGGGRSPSSNTRDYDIINNTKIAELQRGLFLSHYEAHFYDFYPMLTVRESRRIEGLITVDLIDAVEGTHYEDVISLASSDFDPHYIGSSEFSRCGFLLPHSNLLTVEIPYRCIVPKNIGGLLISGRATSQSQNHLQFTRMCPDLIVLGYITGQIAAELSFRKIQPADFDISYLQKEWAKKGDLPVNYASLKPGNRIHEADEIIRRIGELAKGKKEYLYECSRLPAEKAVPVLISRFNDSSVSKEGRLLIAKSLSWFGEKIGNDLIENELNELFDQEQIEGYPDGYTENYDFIRGREKNVLEGLFWRINQNIALLGLARNPQSNSTIKRIIENTSSGGGIKKWTTNDVESKMVDGKQTITTINEARAEYFNGRIDLTLIPFYNRILNLCFYVERIPDPQFIPGFEKLLKDVNIMGYITEEYFQAMNKVYGGELEMYIAAALARCGSKSGYYLLKEYIKDIHFNFKQFAVSELKELTGKDFGYNIKAWEEYISGLNYPQPTLNLKKEIET